MNFEFGNYNARLTFNPADITIRMENRENKRLYETIFVAEDFEGLATIGGLTTLENILKTGFEDDDSNATIKVVEEKIDYICLKVEVKGLIPVSWTIRVDARRRESSDTAVEVEELREKVKKLDNDKKEFEATIEQLEERIIDIENNDYIILSGCPVVIPLNIQSLTLIDTMQSNIMAQCPAGGSTSACYNVKSDRLGTYNMNNQTLTCINGHGVNFPWIKYIQYVTQNPYDFDTNTYLFKGTNISPLKLLKRKIITKYKVQEQTKIRTAHQKAYSGTVQSLTIINKLIRDLSPIGEITQLTSLTINCPLISDISWIKSLKNISTLDFEGCTHLTDVNVLAELPALTKLNIKGTAVKNTTALTNSRLTIEK